MASEQQEIFLPDSPLVLYTKDVRKATGSVLVGKRGEATSRHTLYLGSEPHPSGGRVWSAAELLPNSSPLPFSPNSLSIFGGLGSYKLTNWNHSPPFIDTLVWIHNSNNTGPSYIGQAQPPLPGHRGWVQPHSPVHHKMGRLWKRKK